MYDVDILVRPEQARAGAEALLDAGWRQFLPNNLDLLLVVTHGTFLCMLIGCMMAGEEISPQWFDRLHHFLVLKNTALRVCEYNQGKWQLVIWNDHAHLG